MELGSQVCRPRDPDCLHCPLAALCPAFREGLQKKIPAPRRKPRIEAVREALIVVRRRGRILLVRRAAHRRWAGLWDFPRVPCDNAETSPKPAELAAKVLAATGIRIAGLKLLTTFRHGVTRFRITLECYEARASGNAIRRKPPVETAWAKPSELADYPLSSTGRRLAQLRASPAVEIALLKRKTRRLP